MKYLIFTFFIYFEKETVFWADRATSYSLY